MKRATIDRSWFEGSAEVATIERRTDRALERVTDERASEARRRIASEKASARQRAERPVVLGKMYPVSYWSGLLDVEDETVRSWCKAGELHGQWLRNEWRISEAAMTDFLQRENQRRVRKG
jgi:hypothetical protein